MENMFNIFLECIINNNSMNENLINSNNSYSMKSLYKIIIIFRIISNLYNLNDINIISYMKKYLTFFNDTKFEPELFLKNIHNMRNDNSFKLVYDILIMFINSKDKILLNSENYKFLFYMMKQAFLKDYTIENITQVKHILQNIDNIQKEDQKKYSFEYNITKKFLDDIEFFLIRKLIHPL